MPRPRGGEWLEDEIRSLKGSRVDVVVSLLEREEMVELEILNEESHCLAAGISFLSFPIRDRSVPESKGAKYESQVQVPSKARHVTPGCDMREQIRPESAK